MKADDILRAGLDTLVQRGVKRDQPDGERSMPRIVRVFEAITGIRLTEREGLLFMVSMKLVREGRGAPDADDYIESSAIAPAIIESCPTRIFLPNERAVEPQILSIYRRFGLNDRQIEIVARATPKRDYYCQSARGNRLFELGLGEVALAYTATSSKTDQLAIAEMTEALGPAGFAAAWLRHRGLAWAADMLPAADPVPPAQLGQLKE